MCGVVGNAQRLMGSTDKPESVCGVGNDALPEKHHTHTLMDTQQENEMNKFETYQQIKAANKVSKDWAEMFGKPYHGGGGGTGKIVYLTLGRGEMKSPTIHYQYSNGAQNYHACPTVLIPTLEQVIQDEFPALLKKLFCGKKS